MSQPLAAVTVINPNAQLYLNMMDKTGGPAIQIPATLDSRGYVNLGGVGLDPVNQPRGTEQPLLIGFLVNANSTSEQQIFTMPNWATNCIITKLVFRAASISLTTASFAFGWNAGSDNNVYATATRTELTGATLASVVAPANGQVMGAAGGVFSCKPTIAQGAAATVTVDVYGILY